MVCTPFAVLDLVLALSRRPEAHYPSSSPSPLSNLDSNVENDKLWTIDYMSRQAALVRAKECHLRMEAARPSTPCRLPSHVRGNYFLEMTIPL
jgi:hypothetical protein